MKLNKSYRLLKFINRPFSKLSRVILALISFLPSLLLSLSFPVTKIIVNDFLKREPKLAFRRAGWLVKKSWLKLSLIDDPFFNFTEGLSLLELNHLQTYLTQRASKLDQHEFTTDMLFIQAAMIQNKIELGTSNQQDIEKEVTAFYGNADQLLAGLNIEQIKPQVQACDKERRGDFDADKALEALKYFAEVLPNNVYPWYLISGTLLGFYREKGFLKHDYDIDLGINFDKSTYMQLIEKLQSSSFVIAKLDDYCEVIKDQTSIYKLHTLPAIIKLVHPNGITIDFFLHHQAANMLWHGSSIHRWENAAFDLQKEDFLGVKVYVPTNVEQYLTENYGDWRTPIKSFDCSTGTPNLTIAKNFLSFALFLKRLRVFNQENPDAYKKLEHALDKQGIILNNKFNRELI